MKTRGSNTNPIEPARSKCILPLSTKTQNSIENVSILAPILGHFGYLFRAFCSKVAQGVQGRAPKCAKVYQNGAQGCPNGAQGCPNGPQGCPNGPQGCPNGPPRSPKVPKRHQKVPQACPTGGPRCHNGVPRSPKCHKDATRPHKCHYETKMCPKVPKNKQAHTDTNNQPTK